MAPEDFLAIGLGILGVLGTFLAAAVTLFPPRDNAGGKKAAWLAVFAVLAIASVFLILRQQKFSNRAHAKSEQDHTTLSEIRSAAAPLATELKSSQDDIGAIIREAVARLGACRADQGRCELASQDYTNGLIERADLRELSGSDSADSADSVLKRTAAKIIDREASVRQLNEKVGQLTEKVEMLSVRTCPTVSPSAPTCPPCPKVASTAGWASLTPLKMKQLSAELSQISVLSRQSVWVTYYSAHDSQTLASGIASAFKDANWVEKQPSQASPDGRTFGIAVYGSDESTVSRIVLAIKNATGIDAVQPATHNDNEGGPSAINKKTVQPTNVGQPKSVTRPNAPVATNEGFEVAIGCRPEPEGGGGRRDPEE